MFLCHLAAKPEAEELNINEIFGTKEDGTLDITKTSTLFDLAVMVGRDVGIEQCQNLYGRCQMPFDVMLKFMSQGNMPKIVPDNNL